MDSLTIFYILNELELDYKVYEVAFIFKPVELKIRLHKRRSDLMVLYNNEIDNNRAYIETRTKYYMDKYKLLEPLNYHNIPLF